MIQPKSKISIYYSGFFYIITGSPHLLLGVWFLSKRHHCSTLLYEHTNYTDWKWSAQVNKKLIMMSTLVIWLCLKIAHYHVMVASQYTPRPQSFEKMAAVWSGKQWTPQHSTEQNLCISPPVLQRTKLPEEESNFMTEMATSAPEVSSTSAAPLPTAPVNTIQAVRYVRA